MHGTVVDESRGARGNPVRHLLDRLRERPGLALVAVALALLIVPTLATVARVSWSTEQGGHGPIVLATGLWLLAREWRFAKPLAAAPSTSAFAMVFLPIVALMIIAKITQIIEIEGYLVFATAIAVAYGFIGRRALALLWFPLLYLALSLPPPESLVDALTTPLKAWISNTAISLLYNLGYPIGGAGVTIQIGPYQLLVAQACSGLNSIVSLSAISLFYVFLRRKAKPVYAAFLLLTILPVAIFANFIRVMILILLTYHFGEAAAQGFLHNFAGLAMFVTALLTIFALDSVFIRIWDAYLRRRAA